MILTSEEKRKYRATKGWKAYIKKIRHKYNGECGMCGCSVKRMAVHHLDPTQYKEETNNTCILLCPLCHGYIEGLCKRTRNKPDIFKVKKNIDKVFIPSFENTIEYNKQLREKKKDNGISITNVKRRSKSIDKRE